jgi:hypothetical protein
MSSPVRLLPRAEDATRTYDSNDTPVPQTKTNEAQKHDPVKRAKLQERNKQAELSSTAKRGALSNTPGPV